MQLTAAPRPTANATTPRQLVRDLSDDYVLLSFLTTHGWRITAADDRAGLYWAQRTCKH
ncbi:hypothetical protein [uncultured Deefgea sp.]|uniref:hypothetical protein n=1 Tax=uncultured Deefgea sp. TaxID=1304914 RepID=UPI00262C35FA|nr:hypothetical protein [uncultured Deefgea sp.]